MRNLKHTMRWTVLLVLAAGLGAQAAAGQSQELALGSRMPMMDLELQGIDGANTRLSSVAGDQGTVVVFWSNECPWVVKYEDRLVALANDYMGQGLGFVLVNANDPVAFPKEAAAESQQRARAGNYPMKYVVDPGSRLAVAFGASRTPHVYVFDAENRLVYVGTIDDSPGDPGNVQKQYLKDALDAVVAGGTVAVPQTKAFGCTIKLSRGGG